MEYKDIFERLIYLVEKETKGNVSEFARLIGVGPETIRSVTKYRRNFPGYEVLLKIIQTFEWIEPEWLMTGKGEMKRKEAMEVSIASEPKEVYLTKNKENRLIAIIESQQRTIENLSKKGNGHTADSA